MIDLYYWTTPNGHKITMFFEEVGLAYRLVSVNINQGAQFDPKFTEISPNNRIPAIVDHAPHQDCPGGAVSVFESGAILLYLAEKTRFLLPPDLCGRIEVLQWLFWQVGGLGPMAGQNHHFAHYAEHKIPYAIDRYVRETARLYRVLDKNLACRPFVAGTTYTIADIACYPWIVPHVHQGQQLADFPNLARWFDVVRERPATVRAYALATQVNDGPSVTLEGRGVLFGADAPGRPLAPSAQNP